MSTEVSNGQHSQQDGASVRGYTRSHVANGDAAKCDFLVDLRSDTVTRPSQAMRTQMTNAIVGDDVMGEDVTVKELEQRMAQKLGKEAGLFIPSGSMGNLISGLVHCGTRGAEAIIGDNCHMFLYEQGSMAQFGGILSNPLRTAPNGTYSVKEVINSIRPHHDQHFTKTSLIAVENTHNMCGGRIVPLDWIDEIANVGQSHNIPLHMDGARLFNASVGSGIEASRYVRDFSSVSVCLSKSLGAPVGSVLCGSYDFIQKAKRTRKALGGGMRQAGILAAAGIYCLDHMIDRLAEDHANTKYIAKAIDSLGSSKSALTVEYDNVETNIMMVNINPACKYTSDDVCARFEKVTEQEKLDLGHSTMVLTSPRSSSVIRLVLHCDVSKEMAEKATDKICYVAKELAAA